MGLHCSHGAIKQQYAINSTTEITIIMIGKHLNSASGTSCNFQGLKSVEVHVEGHYVVRGWLSWKITLLGEPHTHID